MRIRTVFPEWATAFALVLLAGNWLRADDFLEGELTDSAPRDERQESRLPDYTRITGAVSQARLLFGDARWHWKFLSARVAHRDGATTMVSLSDAAVADGVLYFGDDAGRLFALRVEDGAEYWKFDHGERINSKPSIDQDHVYFGSRTGITAINRMTGALVWHHDVPHGANESVPLPVGDRVYTSGYDGKTYALDQKTGRALWSHDFTSDSPPDPPEFSGERARFQNIVARPAGSACDGEIFYQCIVDQSRIIALDCRNGERLWSFQADGFTAAAPTVVGNRVFFGSEDRNLYCLDRETGLLVWKFTAPTWLASRPAVAEGRVFLAVHGARLMQLDADSGRLLHTFQPADEFERKGMVFSFPIVANGAVHFASGDGQFFAVDIRTNELRWRLHTSDRSELFTDPVTDGIRIFVTARQRADKQGECAILAIGPKP